MKLKTQEEIEALGYKIQNHIVTNTAFTQGYMQAQSDLFEQASEGFDDFFCRYANECNLHHEFDAHEFWQASWLSHAKKDQEKDAMIEKLEAENEKLKVNLNVCKNDYWFMTNLIERYGSNTEQTLNDCLERMKFRKGLFNHDT